jgi:hypothetical protein
MGLKKTITSIFMVPTLKIPKGALIDNGFINGYVGDTSREYQHQESIYVLFKPTNLEKFKEFLEEEYERTKDIIEEYDYTDGYVVVVYKLNKKYKKDFEKVEKGMYSQTSPSFQKDFSKTISVRKGAVTTDLISLQYKIFNKTQDLVDFWEDKLGTTFKKEYELWEAFDRDKELLDITKIKEELTLKKEKI